MADRVYRNPRYEGMTMSQYYGLLGIGVTIVLTVLACIWLEYFKKYMKNTEPYDEYKAEQERLSYEARKELFCKRIPSKLTAINAVKGEK